MPQFFAAPKSQKKRKRVTIAEPPKKRLATAKPKKLLPANRSNGKHHKVKRGDLRNSGRREAGEPESESEDESDIESAASDDDELDESGSDSGSENETAAEKRARLAERVLAKAAQDVREDYGFDAAEMDREIIAARLQEDVAEFKGKVYKQLANSLAFDRASHAFFKTNTQTVTAVATQGNYAYLATKDLMLQKWRLQDLPQYQYPHSGEKKSKKPSPPPRKQPVRERIYRGNRHKAKDKAYQGHTADILAVAASGDGKFVVTGGADHKIIVYDAETLKPLRNFCQHRSGITGLVFRRGTNQMYSCSRDRVVKIWSLDELAYVGSLFGHEEAAVDIDALSQERCVSVGSRDRTARYWKVAEEKQLVFRGGAAATAALDRKAATSDDLDPRSKAQEGSMDRVAMIDDELFVTGGDSGALVLWSVNKKNPLCAVARAHGVDPPAHVEDVTAEADLIAAAHDFHNGDDVKINGDDTARARVRARIRAAVPPPQPRWITALKTVPYSDVILTGSWDGCVRVWRLSADKKGIEPVATLGMPKSAVEPSAGPSSIVPQIAALPTSLKGLPNGVHGSQTNGKTSKQNADVVGGPTATDAALSSSFERLSDQLATQKHHPLSSLTTTKITITTTLKAPIRVVQEGGAQAQAQAPTPTPAAKPTKPHKSPQQHPLVLNGVINDLSVFERGERGRDGLCVVAAVGREHRFGRWLRPFPGAKNGGCVFEIPRIVSSAPAAAALARANGVNGISHVKDGEVDSLSAVVSGEKDV